MMVLAWGVTPSLTRHAAENAMAATGDKNISLFLTPELDRSDDGSQANEPRQELPELRPNLGKIRRMNPSRTAIEPRVAKGARHELLRQVDGYLRRLTISEACLAVYINIVYCLDRNDDSLTFYEAIESPLSDQWIPCQTWDIIGTPRKTVLIRNGSPKRN